MDFDKLKYLEKVLSLEEFLLLCKYCYYEKHYSIIDDFKYDLLEKEYFKQIENPTNWIGFNKNHPLADKIINLINILWQ